MNIRLSVYLSISFTLAFWLGSPARAEEAISLELDRVVMNYPDGIRFELSASSDSTIKEVILRYGTENQSCQESNAQVKPDFDQAKDIDVEWDWEFLRSGALPPGASLWWQWELRDWAGNTLLSDKHTIQVQDQRYPWKELSEGQLSIQWYEGDTGWGRTLLRISKESLDRLEQEVGGRPVGPIRIVVYPSTDALRDALVTSQEWTGAVAFQQFGEILIAAPVGSDDWIRQALPHELIHLAIQKLTFNCQGVTVPSWLGEGLAQRSEENYRTSSIEPVLAALETGDLLPLKFLEGRFPAQGAQADLAYSQSFFVAGYLIEQYGADKMGELLSALQSGLLIDDALTSIYNFDTYGLDAAWRASLGFEEGDQPQASGGSTATHTAIPTLALWTAVVTATPAPSDTPTIKPIPTATSTPILTVESSPAAISSAPGAMEDVAAPDSSDSENNTPASRAPDWICLLLGGIGLILILILFFTFWFKKRRIR